MLFCYNIDANNNGNLILGDDQKTSITGIDESVTTKKDLGCN